MTFGRSAVRLRIRDARISTKVKPEPRLEPHEICWAQHRVPPASFEHRTKTSGQMSNTLWSLPPNLASSVHAPQKARPLLKFAPRQDAGPELCISTANIIRYLQTATNIAKWYVTTFHSHQQVGSFFLSSMTTPEMPEKGDRAKDWWVQRNAACFPLTIELKMLFCYSTRSAWGQ